MEIVIKDLSKKFDNNLVLDNINMKLTSGNIYGFAGRNGTGKSVLMKIICAFYTPTSGTILQDGNNFIEKNEFPKDTRALIEHASFLPNLTGLENLKLLAEIQNKVSEESIIKWFDFFEMQDEINKKYSKYSLGNKQKLGIIQVLMEDPKLIILDEPFNAIEEISVKRIKKKLLELKEQDKIIIISSHIKEDLEELCDQIFYFDNGKVIQK